MNIEFERTQEDLIAFNLFHISHSPSIQRQVLIMQITMAALIFVLSMSITFMRVRYLSLSSYIVGAVFSVVAYFVWPYIYKWSVIRQAQKMLKEGNNKSLLGTTIMSLSSDGIFYKMLASESKLNWSSVDKVLQNDKYLFIYIGAVNALVIPKNAFTSNRQQKEFLDYVNSNAVQETKDF